MTSYDSWKTDPGPYWEGDDTSVDCPVVFIDKGDNGGLFRSVRTGRYVTAEKALALMERAGYDGPEVEDARWKAKDNAERMGVSA